MSAIDFHADAPLDRRARRTRAAIVSAFNRLVLERGYGQLSAADVAEAADVGRSTFYEHFRGMDDLLGQTLAPLLRPLAFGCFEDKAPEAARGMTQHIWDNRRLARALLTGEAHPVVLRSFAAEFTDAIRRASAGPAAPAPRLEPELIALHLASAQLALLSAWITGRSACSAAEIAEALHRSGRASALALMGWENIAGHS